MICPECGSNQIKVIESRQTEKTIRRRRSCITCGARFNTVELYETRVKALQDCVTVEICNKVIKAMEKLKTERAVEHGKIDV